MISAAEEAYVLAQAYVPEHIVSLMKLISKGEPFLIEDYLGFTGDNWLILVGYPLEKRDSIPRLEASLKTAVNLYKPEYLWFICPAVPLSYSRSSTERESDQYYVWDEKSQNISGMLRGLAMKATRKMAVERSHVFSRDNEELVNEFLQREELSPKLRALYLAMPEYLSGSDTALVLNARDKKGNLTAFYVIDLAARDFATYLLGCYSKINYTPHASDLLFYEMINISKEHDKKMINLGIGVNDGIRRFKMKWGGVAALPYEFCGCHFKKVFSLFDQLGKIF